MWLKIKKFLFHNTTASQTVAKNTFWLSVAHVGGRMLRAIIVIYAARVLGAAEWGVFNYAITLVAFLTIFVDIGISNILTRETAKSRDKEERKRILSTSFVIKCFLVIFGAFIVIFLAPHFTKIEEAKLLFPIVVWILIFDALREFGFAYLRAIERMELEAMLSVAMNTAIVIAGFVFLKIQTDVVSYTYSYALGTGIGLAMTAYTLRDNIKDIRSHFTFSLIKPIIKAAWPFAVSGILGMLTLNTDVVILGWLKSASDLGYYSAGQRVIQILYLLPTIIAISVLPTFARTAKVDDKRFRQIFERIVSVMFMISLPIIIGGIVVGTPLISYLFGSSYAPGSLSFKILLLTLIIDFPVVVLTSAAFAYDRQKSLIIYSAIGGITNVILDLLLIPKFGIEGCAVATVIAQFSANAYLWSIMKKINYFTILPYLKNVIPASILMGAFSYALLRTELHVVGIIAASMPVYFGYLYFTKDRLLLQIRTTLKPAALSELKTDEYAAAAILEETRKRTESD